ncbi:response regulator [Bowmanella yangjiangensis]|uniref:Response regulator n=1 Tax=Bowmanella yangjiangensis TaxID=2811230 RepID=A0ABS3CSC1_9ALTE|nr:response regulator [Bowmanella yangjiangensis]MBN7819404.1 response regulator [Bowmanella yangjiangensis]
MSYQDMTALIVDDDADVRAFLRTALRSMFECNLFEASCGDTAIGIYEKSPTDIVFLDIQMPGKDGLAILAELKQLDANAKVVIVSAHGSMDYVTEAIKLGASGFILKPFHLQKIKAIVDKLLGTMA